MTGCHRRLCFESSLDVKGRILAPDLSSVDAAPGHLAAEPVSKHDGVLRAPVSATVLRMLELIRESKLLLSRKIPEETDARPDAEETTRIVEEEIQLAPRLISNSVLILTSSRRLTNDKRLAGRNSRVAQILLESAL